MDVLLDTSIYRQDPARHRGAFQALQRLCMADHLTLHVPEVVRLEFLTWAREQIDLRLTAVAKSIHELRRAVPSGSAVASEIEELSHRLDSLQEHIPDAADAAFDDWLRKVSAETHDADPSHTARVLSGYFAGKPPFRKVKSREDFPDAFIAATVEDLAQLHVLLHVVVADGPLTAACAALPNVFTYSSLDEFIASEGIATLLQSADLWHTMLAFLQHIHDDQEWLISRLDPSLSEAILNEEVMDGPERDAEPIALITATSSPSRVVLDVDSAVDYGAGTAWLPFHSPMSVQVEYMMEKSDYYRLADSIAAGLTTSEVNKRVVAIAEEWNVIVHGTIFVNADDLDLDKPRTPPVTVGELLAHTVVQVDAIDVVLVESDPGNQERSNGA
jgi:hypothetical protein